MLAVRRKGDSGRRSVLARLRQRWKQSGQSRIVGGPRSFVFLAKPELQYAAYAVASRVSTVSLEINHFTILCAREMTKAMIDIREIETFHSDWKALVDDTIFLESVEFGVLFFNSAFVLS